MQKKEHGNKCKLVLGEVAYEMCQNAPCTESPCTESPCTRSLLYAHSKPLIQLLCPWKTNVES